MPSIAATLCDLTKAHWRNPEQVNQGDCWLWALKAQILVGGRVQCADWPEGGGHAFLSLDGKFYDSEAPDGVHRCQELRCFAAYEKGELKRARTMTLKRFLAENAWNHESEDYCEQNPF